jgi:hypothetical protein
MLTTIACHSKKTIINSKSTKKIGIPACGIKKVDYM